MGDVPQPLHVRHFGHGLRKVLALHCTLAHSGAWRGLAAELAEEVTLTAPDMLSHGRSPDWDGQGDIQDRTLAAVLPLMEGRMDVMGHSFGGTVALRMAVEHPERVRSLILIEPVLFAVAAQDAPEIRARHDEEARPFAEAHARGDRELAARLFNRMWGGGVGPRWPDLPEQTRAAMTRAIDYVPASHGAVMEDRPGLLKPGVLDRVRVPVLLLRGSASHPVIEVVNDGLARRLPDARSEVVEGAGHMLPISNPREVAERIRVFLRAVPEV